MEGTHSISLSLGSRCAFTMATTNPWLMVTVVVVGMVCVTVIAVKKLDGDSKKKK